MSILVSMGGLKGHKTIKKREESNGAFSTRVKNGQERSKSRFLLAKDQTRVRFPSPAPGSKSRNFLYFDFFIILSALRTQLAALVSPVPPAVP